MATTVARLQAVLSANTRDFDQAMDKSHGRLGKVGKAAGVAGGLIGGALVVGLSQSVKEAIQAEKANTRLTQAYSRGVKTGIDPYRKSIEKAGKAAVNLGFDDEDLKDSLGSLIIATHNHKKAVADSAVAMDIARFKNVSLEAATKMLTMAMAGSQRASKQLGLSVQASTVEADKAKRAYDAQKDSINAQFKALGDLTPAQERQKQAMLDAAETQYKGAKAVGQMTDKQVTAGKVIDLVKDKVKGQAKAYSETAEGQMKVFQEKTDNLKEHLGTILLPAIGKVVDKLIVMADWLERNPRKMKLMIAALGLLAGAMLAAAAAQAALNLAVLANPYVAATVGILALAAGAYLLYTRVKQLRPVLEFVAETLVGLPLPLRLVLAATGGLAKNFERLETVLSKIKDLFEWLLDHAKKIGGVFGAIGGAVSHVPGIGDAESNKFKSAFLGVGGSGPKSISQGLYDELSGARTMGLALTSGYRPGARTKHGTRSDHSVYPSKAIDVAGAPQNMARFFRWLIGQTDVKQAFYDPLGSIFGGALSSYREGGHSDHVHVATYDRGGYLKPGWNLAYNGLGYPEPVGGTGPNGDIIINLPNYVGNRQEIMAIFQNWAREYRRRNGRSAF